MFYVFNGENYFDKLHLEQVSIANTIKKIKWLYISKGENKYILGLLQ